MREELIMSPVSSTTLLERALAPINSSWGGIIDQGPKPEFSVYQTQAGESLIFPPIRPNGLFNDCYVSPRSSLYTYQCEFYPCNMTLQNGRAYSGSGHMWAGGVREDYTPLQIDFEDQGETAVLSHYESTDEAHYVPKKEWSNDDNVLNTLTQKFYVRFPPIDIDFADDRLWQFHSVRRLTNGALLVFTLANNSNPLEPNTLRAHLLDLNLNVYRVNITDIQPNTTDEVPKADVKLPLGPLTIDTPLTIPISPLAPHQMQTLIRFMRAKLPFFSIPESTQTATELGDCIGIPMGKTALKSVKN